MSHHLRTSFVICLGILLTCVNVAAAAVPLDSMAEDLKPVSGFVVLPVDGEYLIDLDVTDGISAGDLFAVVEPGEKIVHPVTKEVLGTLDKTKGILKVTRIKSGYSYAKPLQSEGDINKGDTIRRFSNLRAVFRDITGDGESVYARLKSALPALEWQEYQSAVGSAGLAPPDQIDTDLFFVLTSGGLEVRDGKYDVLRTYPVTGVASKGPPPSRPVSPSTTVAPPAVKFEAPSAPSAGAKPEYKPSFSKTSQGNRLNYPVVMSDFIHDGDRLLLAATDGRDIRVFAVNDGVTEIARGDTGGAPDILAVHWWRETPDAELRLAVTALEDGTLESAVFTLQSDNLVPLAERIPYSLGAFDRNGDGAPELLLGQSFDIEDFFGPQVLQLQVTGKNFKASNLEFELPRGFSVQGSLLTDITGDGQTEIIFIQNNRLHIYREENLIFQSSKEIGGTLALASFENTPDPDVSRMRHTPLEVPPVAVDLDNDGVKEILAIASEMPLLQSPGIGPSIKKSWLAVFKYEKDSFIQGRIGEDSEGPLQGLTASPGKILYILTQPGSFFGKEGFSTLVRIPLAR